MGLKISLAKKILGRKILVHGSIVLEYKFFLGPIKFYTRKKQIVSLMEAKKTIVLKSQVLHKIIFFITSKQFKQIYLWFFFFPNQTCKNIYLYWMRHSELSSAFEVEAAWIRLGSKGWLHGHVIRSKAGYVRF